VCLGFSHPRAGCRTKPTKGDARAAWALPRGGLQSCFHLRMARSVSPAAVLHGSRCRVVTTQPSCLKRHQIAHGAEPESMALSVAEGGGGPIVRPGGIAFSEVVRVASNEGIENEASVRWCCGCVHPYDRPGCSGRLGSAQQDCCSRA